MVRRQQQFTVRQPLEVVCRYLSDPAQVGSWLVLPVELPAYLVSTVLQPIS